MKRSKIMELIREVLGEMSMTGGGGGAAPADGGATFTPGQGEQYAQPVRSPKKQTKKKVTKEIINSGYKEVQRPKHPSHTDMWDFKDFRGAKLKN
jgi:hypothetical protein